ncbi:MAG TPA: EAL domain-containing protein [Acidimicrobiales bacterium]|nr:EAL domain-containing protein [Acidimicrobiales bacterium]
MTNDPALAPGGPLGDRSAARATRRLRNWSFLAVVVLLAGIVSSFLVARATAANDAERSSQSFRSSTLQVAGSLLLSIQHEQDLAISADAYMAENTGSSAARFQSWVTAVTSTPGASAAFARYAEIVGLGRIVVTAGGRLLSCTSELRTSGAALVAVPAGFRLCGGTLPVAALVARDTAAPAYVAIGHGSATLLVSFSPVYSGRAFDGWIAMMAVPSIVLRSAIADHPGIAVRMHYDGPGGSLELEGGTLRAGQSRLKTELGYGWSVETFATLASGGLFADGGAVLAILLGLALSASIAIAFFLLATSRVRAQRLVALRTAELRHQALHDPLTDLPNRWLIADRADRLLVRARRAGSVPAALYVDLDEFKNVNDTLGHEAGDLLLEAVAERLVAGLRDADTIGRMGGDEFVVLIEDSTSATAPALVAERLLAIMRQPFELAGSNVPLVVTTSVGIAVGLRDSASDLLRDADVALYKAKAAGKNCAEVFRPEIETGVQRRYELEFALRSALEQRELRLVYQPIYNLDDLSLVGVEALLRWEHPDLGAISPDEFIPLLEASGQIVDVGRFVLVEACRKMAAWREHYPTLEVAVNVSARQLDRNVIVDDVREALQSSGLDPAALTVEITETALMANVESTVERLGDLKALGVQVAIDDFGTGYSSLAYIRRFPIDRLKIDRTFTESITTSTQADAIIHTLVRLGNDLGVKTVAEGIETTGQIDYLRREHVDEAQGYLFAKPLEADVFEAQLLELATLQAAFGDNGRSTV